VRKEVRGDTAQLVRIEKESVAYLKAQFNLMSLKADSFLVCSSLFNTFLVDFLVHVIVCLHLLLHFTRFLYPLFQRLLLPQSLTLILLYIFLTFPCLNFTNLKGEETEWNEDILVCLRSSYCTLPLHPECMQILFMARRCV
jgi:hypothetical protein